MLEGSAYTVVRRGSQNPRLQLCCKSDACTAFELRARTRSVVYFRSTHVLAVPLFSQNLRNRRSWASSHLLLILLLYPAVD